MLPSDFRLAERSSADASSPAALSQYSDQDSAPRSKARRFSYLLNCFFFQRRRWSFPRRKISAKCAQQRRLTEKCRHPNKLRKSRLCSPASPLLMSSKHSFSKHATLPSPVMKPSPSSCQTPYCSDSLTGLSNENRSYRFSSSVSFPIEFCDAHSLSVAKTDLQQRAVFMHIPALSASIPGSSQPSNETTPRTQSGDVNGGNTRKVLPLNLSKIEDTAPGSFPKNESAEEKFFGLVSWNKLSSYINSSKNALTPRGTRKMTGLLTPRSAVSSNASDLPSKTHISHSHADDRLFRPNANGTLITQLGTGPLSRRVFVIRSPTRLNENVITSNFAQTQYGDLLSFCDRLNLCSSGSKSGFARLQPADFDDNLSKSFWPRVLIWDLPMKRPGLASEYPKLSKLVLTFRLLDVGCPTLHFVTSLCSSLLFWLQLTKGRSTEETYAVLSYYEADSVYLSILACILVALDSEAEYPMDASHVCRVLASASRFVDDEQPTLKPPNPKTQRPSRFLAGGALSWLPLHEWRPSSVRLLNHFHHVCDAAAQSILAAPYRVKAVFINNFLGPPETVSVEIYQVYDLSVADARTQRERQFQHALLARYKRPGELTRGSRENFIDQNLSEPSFMGSCSDQESNETTFDVKHVQEFSQDSSVNKRYEINAVAQRRPWTQWKRQFVCENSCGEAQDTTGKKKSSFTKRTLRATKRFFSSRKKEQEHRGNHLLGPYGYSVKHNAPDDASLQLRLVADYTDYSVMMSELLSGNNVNLVLDFVQEGTQDSLPGSETKQPIIVSGDVLIVLRQSRTRVLGQSTSSNWSTAPLPRVLDPYRYDSGIFATYTFHTGFLMQGVTTSEPQFRRIRREDFDILPAFAHIIPDALELYLVCEPLNLDTEDSLLPSKGSSCLSYKNGRHSFFQLPHTASCTSSVSKMEETTEKECLESLTHPAATFKGNQAAAAHPDAQRFTKQNSVAVAAATESLHDHSHHCHFAIEQQRWNSISAQPPKGDVEPFLRHHNVVPRESLLLPLMQEGYSLLASAAALKITDNDAWNAMQLLLRFTQLDAGSQGVTQRAREGLLDQKFDVPFPTFSKEAFDLNLENFNHRRLKPSADFSPSAAVSTQDVPLPQSHSSETHNDRKQSSSAPASKDVVKRSTVETSAVPTPFAPRADKSASFLTAIKQYAVEDCKRQKFPGHPPGPPPTRSSNFSTTSSRFPGSPPGAPPTTVVVRSTTDTSRFPGIAPKSPPRPLQTSQSKQCPVLNQKDTSNKPRRPALPPKPTLPKLHKPPPLGKRIYWKPLRGPNIEGTIFEELAPKNPLDAQKAVAPVVDVSVMVDSTHLNRLFVKQASDHSKPAGLRGSNVTAVKQYHAILDSKRAQNISIILARMSLSSELIADKLRRLDPEGLSLDELDKTEAILLTPEESASFASYLQKGNSAENLRPVPEQQLLPLCSSSTHKAKTSIALLRFQLTYASIIKSLRQNFDIIRTATQQVRESYKFRQVLAVVLRWGNYINYGIASEELYIKGFTLGSLLKLTEFKTIIDPNITSLHYLAANMLQTAPELHLEKLRDDMPAASAAAKVSGEMLSTNIDILHQGVNFLRTELESTSKAYAAARSLPESEHNNVLQDALKQRVASLRRFKASCTEPVKRVEAEYLEVNASAYETCRFFGDDSAHQTGFTRTFRSEHFFQTLDTFIHKFHVCCEEVLRHPQKYQVLLRKPAPSPVSDNADLTQLSAALLPANTSTGSAVTEAGSSPPHSAAFAQRSAQRFSAPTKGCCSAPHHCETAEVNLRSQSDVKHRLQRNYHQQPRQESQVSALCSSKTPLASTSKTCSLLPDVPTADVSNDAVQFTRHADTTLLPSRHDDAVSSSGQRSSLNNNNGDGRNRALLSSHQPARQHNPPCARRRLSATRFHPPPLPRRSPDPEQSAVTAQSLYQMRQVKSLNIPFSASSSSKSSTTPSANMP